MAIVTQSPSRRFGGPGFRSPSRRRAPYLAAAAVVVLALVIGGVITFASASASLTADPHALARIGLPLGGGRIESVSAVTGPHSRPVAIYLQDGRIWPRRTLPAGERITIDAVVRRPGWIAWLAGKTERLHLVLLTPSSRPAQDYLTLRPGASLTVRFTHPVIVIAYGPTTSQLTRHTLAAPTTEITLTRSAAAGSVWVTGLPRTWETAPARPVSWFPAGAATAVVATPAPGTVIKPWTPITLTFSKPVSQALGGSLPPVSPRTPGTWHSLDLHTIVFRPLGYGYGLGAHVVVPLPAAVHLVGGRPGGGSEVGAWTVPDGSTVRLQQLLAGLGYLPLRFTGPSTAPTAMAQESAAIHPPTGAFTWRYGNVPDGLRALWARGASGAMTRGAVMAFENDHGLTPDGDAGPQVWRALIGAALAGRASTFGYSFVTVSLSGQQLSLWHNGRTIMTTAVNTGIASQPTAPGTFAVYEHIRVGTMSGTNPNGSHYNDPGIQYISYFNGGDALHAFTRAQYGFPQSLGCVEMALGPAGQVWPYTPIGTLVHVA